MKKFESEKLLGKSAPAFSLPDHKEEKTSLKDFKGSKNVVLYFYPRDNTPGCTKQACAFQENKSKFSRKDTVIVGVSTDSPSSHQKFIDKFGLKFHLVCDENHSVCEKYKVWVEKNLYGKKSMGILRTTFLINKNGKVVAVWPKVKVDGHVEEVLQALTDHT